ncbi:MAG: hypothetical protein AAFX10_04700 [Pseudomonadota bacterium]
MSDATGHGITVTEIAAMDQPIAASPETTAAFVGRALRGPLNNPVLIETAGEFKRRFGGDMSGSGLGPAVRQFFQQGGQRLYVVRVANQARAAMLCVPASGSALVLRAVDPGKTERVRAAVDFDGIDPSDQVAFNLTLQRLDPETGLIIDQEIHSAVSYREEDASFIGEALADSSIATVEAPYPTHRPDATTHPDSRYTLSWVDAAEKGTDGERLSDYDLVGSKTRSTGIFALDDVPHFDLLYLSSTSKTADCGPTAILAADRYCRKRGAILIMDPPSSWVDARTAVASVRELGYASPNILTYFPRLRVAGGTGTGPVAAGGAIAGLLSKLDRSGGPWQALDQDHHGLARALRPAIKLDDEDIRVLNRAGINALATGTAGRTRVVGETTLDRGSEQQRVFVSLPVRRTCLRIVNSISLATRWVVFARPDAKLTRQLRAQIRAFLYGLANLGALEDDRFIVECDAGHADREQSGITILLTFQPTGSRVPVSFTIHQLASGSRVTGTAFAPVAEFCA